MDGSFFLSFTITGGDLLIYDYSLDYVIIRK